VVDEADAGVELGVAGEPFLDAGHPDEDEPDTGAVVVVAQLLQCRDAEPVCLVHDQQFGMRAGVEHPVLVDTAAGVEHDLDVPAEPCHTGRRFLCPGCAGCCGPWGCT
jgi:hypothetical protein